MKKLLFVSVILAMVAGNAMGAWRNFHWVGANGADWNTDTNWEDESVPPINGVPGYPTNNADWAIVNGVVGQGPSVTVFNGSNNSGGVLVGDGTITIKNGGYIGCQQQYIIGSGLGQTGVVTVETGGSTNMSFAASGNRGSYIGDAGKGTFNTSGTIYTNSNINRIGAQATGVGIVNIHAGTVWTANKTGNFVWNVGYMGNGTINIDGGSFTIPARLDITKVLNQDYVTNGAGSSYGHIDMSGGIIQADHLYMEVNSLSLNAGTPEVRATIKQTGGEFIFTGIKGTPALALSRVIQAIDLGWWTTGPGQTLVVTSYDQSTDGYVHVTVTPEPAAIILLGLGSLLMWRRRR